jgi:hypothetical protein
MICVVAATVRMCFTDEGYLNILMRNEIEMMFALSGFALFLLMMSWLDEAAELSLFSSADDTLVNPWFIPLDCGGVSRQKLMPMK